MTKTLRQALPMVGAIALVGSAVMAGSGTALAGRPVPEIDGGESGNCWPSSGGYAYATNVDLSANKGRWGFVMATLVQDGEEPQEFFVDAPLQLRTEVMQRVEVHPPGPAKPAVMTVTVTDRKGVPYEGPASFVTTVRFCE